MVKYNAVIPQSGDPVNEADGTAIVPSPPSSDGAALFPQGQEDVRAGAGPNRMAIRRPPLTSTP